MAKFKVGDSVRFVLPEDALDPLADDLDIVGDIGTVVAAGRYFADDPEAGYDCVVFLESYGDYCAWDWQLEPVTPLHAKTLTAEDILALPQDESREFVIRAPVAA